MSLTTPAMAMLFYITILIPWKDWQVRLSWSFGCCRCPWWSLILPFDFSLKSLSLIIFSSSWTKPWVWSYLLRLLQSLDFSGWCISLHLRLWHNPLQVLQHFCDKGRACWTTPGRMLGFPSVWIRKESKAGVEYLTSSWSGSCLKVIDIIQRCAKIAIFSCGS